MFYFTGFTQSSPNVIEEYNRALFIVMPLRKKVKVNGGRLTVGGDKFMAEARRSENKMKMKIFVRSQPKI
jgi:hypothetical protein